MNASATPGPRPTTGMLRTEAVAELARHRDDSLSIVTMQAASPWIAARQHERRNLNLLGSMGSAGSIGLGLALSRPDDPVLILDGDGSLLMQLATLVSIAGESPSNLYHVVFENGTYETSGGQPVPGREVMDWCGLALAAGYRQAVRFDSTDDMATGLPPVLAEPGPALIALVISGQGEVEVPADVELPPDFAGQVHALRAELAAAGDAP